METEELREDIEPVLAPHGFSVVEVQYAKRRQSGVLTVVVHSDRGVTLGDCEAVAKIVRHHPALAGILIEADLEVCSPGVNRKIRSGREYRIFRGKGVRMFLRSSGTWVGGRIEASDAETVTIRKGDESVCVPLGDVKRAFLDYTQEVQV